jgi:hypothetical protein
MHILMRSNAVGLSEHRVGYLDLDDQPKSHKSTQREEFKTKIRTFLDDPSSSSWVGAPVLQLRHLLLATVAATATLAGPAL